jgi:hypothetical protein
LARLEREKLGKSHVSRAGTVFAMGSDMIDTLSAHPLAVASSETQEPPNAALAVCKCGTDRTRREATPEREYTFFGTLYALWGGTAVPTRVTFRCVRCGVAFDAATDRATCRRFII